MPYENQWEPHGVNKRFWGVVTGPEFVRAAEEIAAHPRFDEFRYILNDFRDATAHCVDARALEDLAAIRFGSMYTNHRIRVAVVSTHPDVLALVASTQRAPLKGSHPTAAFATVEAARAWLAGPAHTAPPHTGPGPGL